MKGIQSVEQSRKIGGPAILATIAGSLILLSGIGSLAEIGWISNSHYTYWPMMRGGMMGGNGWPAYAMSPQMISWWLGTMSVVSIVVGGVLLTSAYKLYTEPNKTKQWGLIILLSSAIGLLGFGGFAIGSILGLIGGAMAISRTR